MRQHASIRPAYDLSPHSIPLSDLWSVFTSDVVSVLTEETAVATFLASAATTTIPASATMVTTEVGVPISTITVDTTILRTSFVTVPVTTELPDSTTTSRAKPAPTDRSSRAQPTIGSSGRHASFTTSVNIKGPSTTPTLTLSFEPHRSIVAPSATVSPTISASHTVRKHAIIGGLSGSIAGLVLIGMLLCICIRRRRPPREDEDEVTNEKGLRPAIARKWSHLTTTTTIARPPPALSRASTPDLDGGLIRVSLEHWPRPFAHSESFRESVGPGRLRVTNPDPSRPATPHPRPSLESMGSFLKWHRSAIAAVLAGSNRSRASSVAGSSRNLQIPAISIEPSFSSESVTRNLPPPSFRSYPSVATLPTIQQLPPEDPFLTPPEEREEPEPVSPAKQHRPSIVPLQAAGRTLSHVGSALNPFRTKSNFAESVKSHAHSRNSFSTFSSAGDPFKLDRPSIYEGHTRMNDGNARTANELERHVFNRPLYEGT